MSDRGYGTQGGPYPPDGPNSPDQNWGGGQPQPPQQQPEPWGQSPPPEQQQNPYGDTAPTSGSQYTMPQQGYPDQQQAGFGQPPSSGAGYGAPPPQFGDTRPLPAGPPPGSAPPFAGGPQPGPGGMPMRIPPTPTKSKGPWIPLLAATTALFLVVSLVMSVLYFTKSGQQNDTATKLAASETTVSERNNQIKDKDGKISALEAELKKTKSDLESTKQQLQGTQNKVGTLTEEKAIVSQCLKLVLQYIAAVADRDTAKASSLLNQLNRPCNQANAIIN